MDKRMLKGIVLVALIAVTGLSHAAISIITPAPGHVVVPGSTIDMQLTFPEGYEPMELYIDSHGGGLDIGISEHYTTAPFDQVQVTIPPDMAGPKTLTVETKDANAVWDEGSVDIVIVPQEAPVELRPTSMYIELLAPPAETGKQAARIGVEGVYVDGTKRKLESALVGTTYTSSEPGVATVDADGNVQAISPGMSVITVEHKGVRSYPKVFVGDGSFENVPPLDLSSSVSIAGGGFRYNNTERVYVQQISVTNLSDKLLPGSVTLVIYDLPSGVSLVGKNKTAWLQPVGSQYVLAGPEDVVFLPGQTTTTLLKFKNPLGVPITYQVVPYWSRAMRH